MRASSRRRRVPLRVGFGAAAVLAASHSVAPAQVAPVPWLCAAVQEYDARPDKPAFLDLFEDMAFSVELCADAGGRCQRDGLFRVARPIRVVVTAPGLPQDDPRRFVLGANYSYAFEILGRYTGVSAEVGDFESFDRHANFFFFLEDRAGLDELINGGGAYAPFASSLTRRLNDLDAPCWTEPRFREDYGIPLAVVFIRTDLVDEVMLSQCVLEELYNSIGPGDAEGEASLFDDDWRREDPAEHPEHYPQFVRHAFSARDLAVLNLYYSDLFEVGEGRESVMAKLEAFLEETCGAARFR